MLNFMKFVTMALLFMFTFYSQLKAISHINLNNLPTNEHAHSINSVLGSSFVEYFLTGEHSHQHEHNDHTDEQEESSHSHSHQHTVSWQFFSSDFIQNDFSFKILSLKEKWPLPKSQFLAHLFQFEILRPPINS